MKNIRKWTAVLTALLLLVIPCALHASAEEVTEPTLSVDVRIEGISRCFYNDTVTAEGESMKASDLLRRLDEQEDTLEFTMVDGDYGAYLSAVNGEEAGVFKSYDGWLFRVNGVEPDVGIGDYVLKNGDALLLYYGDPFGTHGMQYPEVHMDNFDEGILTFTSMDTTFDENWQEITKENPVAGMTVEWISAENNVLTLVTDENGTVTVPAENRAAGTYTMRYSRYAEDGCPTVLRPEDIVISIEAPLPTESPAPTEAPVPTEEPVPTEAPSAEPTPAPSANPATGDAPMGVRVAAAGALFAGALLALKRRV